MFIICQRKDLKNIFYDQLESVNLKDIIWLVKCLLNVVFIYSPHKGVKSYYIKLILLFPIHTYQYLIQILHINFESLSWSTCNVLFESAVRMVLQGYIISFSSQPGKMKHFWAARTGWPWHFIPQKHKC